MKKATNKKSSKKSNKKDAKKKRSYISDMMRRDMESCLEKDKELAKAGVQKPKKDIIKDDPCYGCKFALENKDISGPFDRRFKCNGFPRIVNELKQAIAIVWKCGIGNQKFISSMSSCPISKYGHVTEAEVVKHLLRKWRFSVRAEVVTEAEVVKHLLHAQNSMLCAASLIGERVANGKLECIETSGKPSCFVGADLDEYLNQSSNQ